MRRLPARILSPFLQFFVKHYFKKPRTYRFEDLKIKVFPGVFFPHFTLSTKLLLEFLKGEKLNGVSFLELGCGTGIISCFAAKKGAKVVASDINKIAIDNANFNAEKNDIMINAIHSDLFDNLIQFKFDYIVINPPYYPKNPQNDSEKAWFCGEGFEYFKKLFKQLSKQNLKSAKIIMILSEDCDLEMIKSIAQEYSFSFELLREQKKLGEINYIFQIVFLRD